MKRTRVNDVFWNVWVLRDGKKTFYQSYFTHDSAARDAAKIPGAIVERSE